MRCRNPNDPYPSCAQVGTGVLANERSANPRSFNISSVGMVCFGLVLAKSTPVLEQEVQFTSAITYER
jgi:hypothetical protein